MFDAGCWMLDAGCGMWDAGYWVLGIGFISPFAFSHFNSVGSINAHLCDYLINFIRII